MNPLTRYKVMLEDHNDDGTVTRKEFALEDFQKLFNAPGTFGSETLSKEVYVKKGFTEIGTLPKGAAVESVALKADDKDAKVSLGTEENKSQYGEAGMRRQDGTELEEEQTIGIHSDRETRVQVVVKYSTKNEL